MAANKTLINFIVEDALLKRIEDFRFKNRFQTRAAAIKWLIDWALKQKPSVKSSTPEAGEQPIQEDHHPAEGNTVEPPVPSQVPDAATKPASVGVPSQESITQALKDQGYEIGATARHPDGQERILVRSKDGSAWVNVVQELQDLAATRITLQEIAARRAIGK